MPELGPGEALVAVMAARSTTTPCGPRSSSRCRPSASCAGTAGSARSGQRHDLPYHVVGSDLSGVVLRTGPGRARLAAGRRGRRALPVGRAGAPDGHDDTMLDPEQRIWGFETNFGGLAELALVKANQLMPKPAHLTWEEAAGPGAGQLHRVPAARLAQRRRDEAGRHRADLGRERRPRLRTPPSWRSRRARPRSASCPARRRPSSATDGRRAGHRPDRGGLPVLVGRAHPGPEGVAAARREIRELTGGRRRRHRLRAPGPRDLRRQRLRRPPRRHHRDLRLDVRVPARVRQPVPLDEPQAHRRLALRELPRGVGGERPDRPRADPPDAVPRLPARATPARRPPTCTATATRARSACCAWPPRRAWASATPSCGPSTRARSTASATSQTRPLTRGRQRSVVHRCISGTV